MVDAWRNAPEDAQGFMPGDPLWIAGWWKQDAGSNYWWSFELGDQGGWKKSYANPFDSPKFQKRHDTQPTWNGPEDGLPPVGINLQWFSPTYGWIGGKVVAHDGQTIIVRHNDGYEGCHLHNVKPCRTPEQIAADARAATIKRLAALCPQPRADFTGVVIEALLDAGMIKDDAQ